MRTVVPDRVGRLGSMRIPSASLSSCFQPTSAESSSLVLKALKTLRMFCHQLPERRLDSTNTSSGVKRWRLTPSRSSGRQPARPLSKLIHSEDTWFLRMDPVERSISSGIIGGPVVSVRGLLVFYTKSLAEAGLGLAGSGSLSRPSDLNS